MDEEIFRKIREIVEKEVSCSSHNMTHIDSVHNTCLLLAKGEKVDLDVLRAAALLHDIARVMEDSDPTGNTDHALLGAEIAAPILEEARFSDEKIRHVQDCIITHRSRTDRKPQSLEAKILFDADKLDSIGAVGLFRAIMWVGKHRAKIYDKTDKESVEKYIEANLGGKVNGRIQDKSRHSIQMDYVTKTRFLLEKLHTERAKEVGKERLEFFKAFIDRLEQEMRGEK